MFFTQIEVKFQQFYREFLIPNLFIPHRVDSEFAIYKEYAGTADKIQNRKSIFQRALVIAHREKVARFALATQVFRLHDDNKTKSFIEIAISSLFVAISKIALNIQKNHATVWGCVPILTARTGRKFSVAHHAKFFDHMCAYRFIFCPDR